MCGIAGIINLNNSLASEEELLLMMQAMKHRGPDDQGTYVEGGVGLGFVRLSVIDLTAAGHQPFRSNDGRYTMVYNGEIYNYLELKEDLIRLGHVFHTNTDTEVLLNAYIEWGEDVLDKLNGMWAFAILDREDMKMFIARDRYGIKPFYYCVDNDRFIFSSEIPCLLKVISSKPKPNNEIIFNYLVFNRTEHSGDTFFEGICKLMHGHKIHIDLNKDKKKIVPEKWYDIKERVENAKGFMNPSEFRNLFQDSIKLRLRSDVPVGVCLSGGLDSSTITSIILDDFKKPDLNTFSAVYDQSFYGNESGFIDNYQGKVDNMHYVTPDGDSLLNDLDTFIACHGEPLPSTSPYAQFKVMELAKGNVVVTLDGQGADEYLAGYHYFFGFYYKDLLFKFRFLRLIKEIYYYLKIHKSLYALKTFAFLLLPKNYRTKAKVFSLGYFKKDFIAEHQENNLIADKLYGSDTLQSALINHFEYKLEHLLKWEDRNSMFFSLEARVPFLDYRVVERGLATSSDKIIRNGMTKHILRESMKGTLPETIRLRVDKNGFSTPQDEWFRSIKWQDRIWNIINSNTFKSRGYFDVDEVSRQYRRHLSGKNNIAKEIWKWIHLELWFRRFID